MRISRQVAIIFSGLIWLGVGFLLLSKGLKLIAFAALSGESFWLMQKMQTFWGEKQQAALFLISAGLLVGFIKGRFLLAKTVKRVVERIVSLPNPIPLAQIYDRRYLILLSIMMSLGMGLKFVNLPSDILGTIDVTIGSALVNGALIYLRYLVALGKTLKS